MTVRLAMDIGMDSVVDVARRFDIAHGLQPYLAGCAGRQRGRPAAPDHRLCDAGQWRPPHQPSFIERIQDRNGAHGDAARQRGPATAAAAVAWAEQPPPGAAGDPRAGRGSALRLPDGQHAERRGRARDRRRPPRSWTGRSPARPAPPTTTRTPGSSASRPISWSASGSASTSRGAWARTRPAPAPRCRSGSTSCARR